MVLPMPGGGILGGRTEQNSTMKTINKMNDLKKWQKLVQSQIKRQSVVHSPTFKSILSNRNLIVPEASASLKE